MLRVAVSLLCMFWASAPLAVAQPYDFSGVTSTAERIVREQNLPGAVLAIVKDNQVLYKQAFGNYTFATQVQTASAAKWLSGIAVSTLVDRGVLSWQSKVGDYFPGLPPVKAAITLEQLMSHTSGVDNKDDAPCLNSRAVTLDACARQVLAEPLIGVPGSVFSYGGNAMQVAGRIAEIATGKDWNAIFRENVALPLGLANTDYAGFLAGSGAGYTAVSNPRVAGGMRSTIDDYLAVVNMLARNGLTTAGASLLKPPTVVATDENRAAGATIYNTALPGKSDYAIGHWLDTIDGAGRPLMMSSAGAFGFTPFVDRALGYGAVWLMQGSAGAYVPARAIMPAVDAAIRAGTAPNETGVWWNPRASGVGLVLSRQGDILFGALYTYAADGSAEWLVASNLTRQVDGSFAGSLYRASRAGGATTPERVGTMSIGAASADGKRALNYEVNGARVSMPIEPFVFRAPTYCRATTDVRTALTNLTDIWWDPRDSGVGVAMAQQGDTVFAVIYRYDANGNPRWYVASDATRRSDGAFLGTLSLTRATGTPTQPNVSSTAVGTFAFTPRDGSTGTLTYDVAGASTTLALQRFDFSTPQTACY